MNLVLDVLLLRRPLLRYISPPVCPVSFSGSGSGVMVEAVNSPTPPSGLVLAGQCNRFLTWDRYPNLVGMVLYRSHIPGDIYGPYDSVTEDTLANFVGVCTPGWWKATTSNADGVETDPCEPVLVTGTGIVQVPIPVTLDAVRINLYKNPNPSDPNQPFALVLSTVSNGAFELCDPSGCYRLQAITDDGISELSLPVCRDASVPCCPPQHCVDPAYMWDASQCSCVLGAIGFSGPTSPCCANVAYSSAIQALGGFAPINWELISGTIPPGLIFHTGLFLGYTAPIDGTPTTPGAYSFVVKVTDVAGNAAQDTVTILVSGLDQTFIPSGVTDTPYSTQLTSGSSSPVFSLYSGELPGGLTLSAAGVISGLPLSSYFDTFVVETTDTNGLKCHSPVAFLVYDCPTPVNFPTIAYWGL